MPARKKPGTGASTRPGRTTAHQPWSEAGSQTIAELADNVHYEAKKLDREVDVAAVHDMRTATRRLRTAIMVYREIASKRERKRPEKELRRVARRLGSVRDLDVLIKAVDEERVGDRDGLGLLRRLWSEERRRSADRLTAEIARRRFRRSLVRAARLGHATTRATARDQRAKNPVVRVGHQAPGLIWEALAALLAFDLDPTSANPDAIHQMRIAAKQFRYTLEAFEDTLPGAAPLIRAVTGLQDAAGEMHDAIVARDRATSVMRTAAPSRRQRRAIGEFVRAQDRRIETSRTTTAKSLRKVRGRPFRGALDHSIVTMSAGR